MYEHVFSFFIFFLPDLRTPTVLQDSLVPCLLFTEAGQSLLNILGTGVDTVDRLVSLGRYLLPTTKLVVYTVNFRTNWYHKRNSMKAVFRSLAFKKSTMSRPLKHATFPFAL